MLHHPHWINRLKRAAEQFSSQLVISVAAAIVVLAAWSLAGNGGQKITAGPASPKAGIDPWADPTSEDVTIAKGTVVAEVAREDEHLVDPTLLSLGDQVKIMVLERLEALGEGAVKKNGAIALVEQTILTGDYVVQQSGHVAIPMLGAFAAAEQSIDHLTREVRKAYIAAFHQDAKVSISIVDRRPIYVLGAGSKAGTFKFSPGMTVSHALALLGGSDDERRDVYLQSELVRQRERHATSVRRLEKALVRSVVLHAERDGETPRPTSALVSISGGEKATLLIQKELNVRKLIGDLKQSQTDAARSAIATAQREIADISAKVTILNEHIGVKKLRKEALSRLTDSRSANPFLSNQVTGEVLDVEERRQEVLLSQSQAQRKLDQAKADLSKLLTEQALELEKEIAVVEQEVTEEGSAVSSSDLFVQELRMQDAGANMASDAPRFEIVRQTLTGPQRLSADEMTELKAGDLVQVRSNRPQ